MLLADLGAEIIVVHRKQAPVPGLPERSLLDRGKRSIALDLRDAEDVAVLMRLIATADGLIEGFRPGVMERLGLGPDACQAVNKRLVYGRMTGWGQDGPLARTAGHDMNYTGVSGALWYASLPGEPPMAPPTLTGDIGGGALYLVIGMLAGIINARASGEGTVVDAAIVDGSAHMMNLLMVLGQIGGLSAERGTSLLDGPHWCRVYRTSDGGFISVQCIEPRFYAQFARPAWPRRRSRNSPINSIAISGRSSAAGWRRSLQQKPATSGPACSRARTLVSPQCSIHGRRHCIRTWPRAARG